MVVNGKALIMFAIVQELEQQFECRSLEFELEQLSVEFEQQCEFTALTTVLPQILNRNSGTTGRVFPALSEINQNPLFGKRKLKTRGFI